MLNRPLAAAAMIAALAACAQEPAPPRSAEMTTSVVERATVQAVDMETRQVLLRDANGEVFEVVAGPDVRNLAQLAPGDVVRFEISESVAVEMATPDAPGEPVGAIAATRAPEGERPGAAVGLVTDQIVSMISYDPISNRAAFRRADGSRGVVTVPPELRGFAADLAPGDRVRVTIVDALAITIEEVAA